MGSDGNSKSRSRPNPSNVIVILVIMIIFYILNSSSVSTSSDTASVASGSSESRYSGGYTITSLMEDQARSNKRLMELVETQEDVIKDLTKEVERMHVAGVAGGNRGGGGGLGEAERKELEEVRRKVLEMELKLAQKDREIIEAEGKKEVVVVTRGGGRERGESGRFIATKQQEECDRKFGKGLMDEW